MKPPISLSSISLILLTTANLLFGMAAAMLMMNDDFLNAFYEAKGHILTGTMDEFLSPGSCTRQLDWSILRL